MHLYAFVSPVSVVKQAQLYLITSINRNLRGLGLKKLVRFFLGCCAMTPKKKNSSQKSPQAQTFISKTGACNFQLQLCYLPIYTHIYACRLFTLHWITLQKCFSHSDGIVLSVDALCIMSPPTKFMQHLQMLHWNCTTWFTTSLWITFIDAQAEAVTERNFFSCSQMKVHVVFSYTITTSTRSVGGVGGGGINIKTAA